MKTMYSDYNRYQNVSGKGSRLIFLLMCTFLMISGSATAATVQAQERESEEETYLRARDFNLRGEWGKAIELYRHIASGDSPRAPEAAFYLGLCLENLPGKDEEAYQIFEALQKSHPDDPIVEKALSHQIILAGMLGEKDRSYREFLVRMLDSDEPGVRCEAALSLARFGDERAVDCLQEVLREGNKDQQLLALERIPNFDLDIAERMARDARRRSQDPDIQARAASLEESLKATRDERRRMERLLTRDKKLLMETIKRQGDTWTEEELLTQALFHIMPSRTLANYVQGNTAEKLRIYENFIGDIDRQNRSMSRQEIEQELHRRIDYATSTYGEPWRATRSRFDAQEWLTPDNAFAPWDARGELIIRYGEPSDIYIIGNNIAEWYYANLRVDFTIHEYKLNFFLNAIYPGRASQQDYPAGQVQANYISIPRIEF